MANREIKFRAWDEQKKTMHNDFQFVRTGTEGNDWIVFVSDKQFFGHEWSKNPYFAQQLKLMQYTGLKDKNGKEIYEGDILRFYHSDLGHEIIQKVTFSRGCFCRKAAWWDIPLQEVNRYTEYEVIGNIYETPELIEDFQLNIK